jgi:hypothetical protein
MTHEYLVEAINSPTYRNSRNYEHPYLVIGAILELHAPRHEVFDDVFNGGTIEADFCKSCPDTEYPCLTIEVLKAELNA